MCPIDIGVGFDALEKMVQPKLVPDGSYNTLIEKVDDSPVQQSGRPQWRFQLKVADRPDLEAQGIKYLFVYAQLPWIDPDTRQWDYSFCFTIVDIINASGMIIQGNQIPDKEVFVGRSLPVRVGQRVRKGTENDPEGPTYDNTVKIIAKKHGGSIVS